MLSVIKICHRELGEKRDGENHIQCWEDHIVHHSLNLAGGVLPVVGICILLNYLPTRSKLPFLILGFLLAAYVKIPLIGVAGFGLVITLLDYMYTRQADQRWAANQEGSDLDE